MSALRVTFERGGLPEMGIERSEVSQFGHITNLVEELCTFNFDLPEALIHHIQGRSTDVTEAGGAIDRHRCQAVAKRVLSRTRFALLSLRAAAF
jgi:hypothetical protein